jgi:hypothetical protein
VKIKGRKAVFVIIQVIATIGSITRFIIELVGVTGAQQQEVNEDELERA